MRRSNGTLSQVTFNWHYYSKRFYIKTYFIYKKVVYSHISEKAKRTEIYLEKKKQFEDELKTQIKSKTYKINEEEAKNRELEVDKLKNPLKYIIPLKKKSAEEYKELQFKLNMEERYKRKEKEIQEFENKQKSVDLPEKNQSEYRKYIMEKGVTYLKNLRKLREQNSESSKKAIRLIKS